MATQLLFIPFYKTGSPVLPGTRAKDLQRYVLANDPGQVYSSLLTELDYNVAKVPLTYHKVQRFNYKQRLLIETAINY